MPTPSERMGILEQRLMDHEATCAERLAEIKAAAASTLAAVEGLKTRSWTMVVALLAWALAQLWSANQARLDRVEPTPSSEQFTVDGVPAQRPSDWTMGSPFASL